MPVRSPDTVNRLLCRNTDAPRSDRPAIYPIDKPDGCPSFDVVRQVRRRVSYRKVGHAGTLDPMATGLLIVMSGRKATRCSQYFLELPKTYRGRLRLGQTTLSYDAETEVVERSAWDHVTDAMLEEARASLTGHIVQQAPLYSAVRVRGERLYKKARRGEHDVQRPPRQVVVERFEILSRSGPDVTFLVKCSKGTYIRTLAHDLGQALGVGAHLTALRRTAIGSYTLDEAWKLDALLARLDETA